MRRLLLMSVLGFGSLLAHGAWWSARAQTLTAVRNFLNPEALLAREALTLIEGESFTDEEELFGSPFDPPTMLAGVQVLVDGKPQRLRSVSATRVVFILDAAGAAARNLELRPKTGAALQTPLTLANAGPGVLVKSEAFGPEAFLPELGLYNNMGQPGFIPIGSLPLPLATNRETVVVINGSGWRFATTVSVRLNGQPCRVVSFGPSNQLPLLDELVFLIPPLLADYGPVDLVVTAAGRESNYARLELGRQQ